MDCNTKRASNERIAADREQLWTAAPKGRAMKGLHLNKIHEQLWVAALKGRATKGLQLIVSSYGLQYQKGEQ